MTSSSVPMIAVSFHSARVGRSAPRQRAQAMRSAPAMRKRTPIITNGGMVSMAKRIARYVEPQST